MRYRHKIAITLPDLSPQTAFALVCWLEDLTHEVSLYYSDEVRSELQRQDNDAEEDFDYDDTIPF